jgi:hypothetical protein
VARPRLQRRPAVWREPRGQIADARAAGATDLEFHDTVQIAAASCMMNRYVDGLAAITAGAQRLIKDG